MAKSKRKTNTGSNNNNKSKLMQEYLNSINELQQKYNELIDKEGDIKDKIGYQQELYKERQEVINLLQENYNDLTNDQKDKLNDLVRLQVEQKKQIIDIVNEQKNINKQLQNEIEFRKKIVDSARALGVALLNIHKELQAHDKIIRTTILNLGMSGVKAEMIRSSFEKSAGFAVRLGGSLSDIQNIMEGFADETGRARALSENMVKDIMTIGKGTGLGVENATKLGSQFEIMGIDTKKTLEYVQGVVDTSERMGVNTTKVLKNVSDNFKKLQTYNFQQGVKGFAQMAEFAEKFKISVNDALNAADTARTLEGAIDMVAQLQVMGGEFAKLDMFETLYFARNDPAKLQEKIAELTKGIVTLRKNSDGSFEKFISPADRDRLNQVAKALGISKENMTEMALRAFDINKMSQELAGMGLSEREKQLIQGAAVFNSETGKFQVKIGEHMRDISSLTKDDIKRFESEKSSLEERAKQAMTFNETLKSTIESLKVALLPILRGVNILLQPLIKIANGFSKLADSGWGGVATAAGILLTAGGVWNRVTKGLNQSINNWATKVANEKSGTFSSKTFNLFKGNKTTTTSPIGGNIPTTGTAPASTTFSESAGAGLKSLGTGAGIGAALAGAGAGINIAAQGISKLADSMSKLTKDQAENLKSIAMTLAITFPAAAVGIGIVAAVAAPAAPVLLALGAALLMIGGAVGIAAAGIGLMGKGLAEMFNAVKGSENTFLNVASGIGVLALTFSTAGLSVIPAALGLSFAIGRIAKHAESINKVGEAFNNIKAVMSGSKEDFIAVENAVKSISSYSSSNNNSFAELVKLLKEPIYVKFSDDKIVLQNDITLDIDGNKFMNKVYNTVIAVEKQNSTRSGRFI